MIILVLIDPTTYLQSALVGLELFGTKVAPALFPFFFFTGILTRCGFAEGMGRLLRRPAKLLYRVPGCGGYVWCMSILSGYPVGAKLTRELYDGGAIDRAQAEGITAFTSTSGPLFIVGTVAAGMFQNAKAGYILLVMHFTAALANGFLYRAGNRRGGTAVTLPRMRISSALSESMKSALISCLTVGGFVVIFGMAADAVYNTGLITALAKPLSRIMPNGSVTFDRACGSHARSRAYGGRGHLRRSALPFLYIGVRGAFDNTAIAVVFVRMRNKRGKIFENEIHSKLYCAAFCSIIRYCNNRRFMI